MGKFKKKNGVEYFYANDMVVSVEKRKHTSTVSFVLAVGAGVDCENIENNGISHYLEHILINGSELNNNMHDLLMPIIECGGKFNAGVGPNFTKYYVTIPSSSWEVGLLRLLEIVFLPSFEESTINNERSVILSEINRLENYPGNKLLSNFMNSAFPNVYYSLSQGGTAEVISNLTKSDLISYYRDYYNVSNMALACVGNIKTKDINDVVNRFFYDYSVNNSNKSTKPCKDNIIVPKSTSIVINANLKEAMFLWGVRTCGFANNNITVISLELINIILNSCPAILRNEIRIKRGLAYLIGSHLNFSKDYGYFGLTGASNHKNLQQIFDVFEEIFENIANVYTNKKNIESAKKFLIGKTKIDNESNYIRASNLAVNRFLGIKSDLVEYYDNINSIVLQDIMDVAIEYLLIDNVFKVTLK